MLSTFAKQVDVDSLRVQAPKPKVLICGGKFDFSKQEISLSMRDAYLKLINNPTFKDTDLVLAEDITKEYLSESLYDDILNFENDLAQACDLVILFCESEGSFAELGSFSVDREISSKLFVVVRNKHFQKNSFIKLGPLQALANIHEQSVFVIHDNDIGIVGDSHKAINRDTLRDQLRPSIEHRLGAAQEHTTFNRRRAGHLVKLITGIVQEFGALTRREIHQFLVDASIKIPKKRVAQLVLCGKAIDWLGEERRGTDDLIFPLVENDAAIIRLKEGVHPRDKMRRRVEVQEYWKENDNNRYVGILDFRQRSK
jgi:hypothetical protein